MDVVVHEEHDSTVFVVPIPPLIDFSVEVHPKSSWDLFWSHDILLPMTSASSDRALLANARLVDASGNNAASALDSAYLAGSIGFLARYPFCPCASSLGFRACE
jgi:hypothetical protein